MQHNTVSLQSFKIEMTSKKSTLQAIFHRLQSIVVANFFKTSTMTTRRVILHLRSCKLIVSTNHCSISISQRKKPEAHNITLRYILDPRSYGKLIVCESFSNCLFYQKKKKKIPSNEKRREETMQITQILLTSHKHTSI